MVAHLLNFFVKGHLGNEVVDALIEGQIGIEPGAGL
jgi:hypothetical protein